MTSSIGFTATLITPANFFVAALYDASNVSTVLESQQVPKGGGYLPDFEVTFLYNLQQDRVYRVVLWESVNTAPAGMSRGSHDFKASLNSIKIRGSLYLTADVSPGLVSGGTPGYVDPTSSLAGWTYDLEQVGYGTLEDGVGNDYTRDGTTNDWTLINGAVITNLMKFVLHFQAQVTVAPQPPISAISTGRVITTSTTLTAADKNKALWVRASGSSITINLMALSSLADYDHVVIYSAGGNHINLVINTAGTDKIQLNSQVIQIILGQAEKLDLVKENGQFEVDFLSPSYWDVGKYIYRPTKGEVNTAFGNGGYVLRADYPRITNYVLMRLTSNDKVAEATWANAGTRDGITYYPNKSKWTEGDGSTNIHLPLLYNTGFLRGVNGTSRFSGDLEYDQMIDHQHEGTIGTLNATGPDLFGIGAISRNKGNYNGRGSGACDLVSKAGIILPSSGLYIQSQKLGNEVHPPNTGIYISICI